MYISISISISICILIYIYICIYIYMSCIQEHLYRHFSTPGHGGFLNDVSVTLIDKMDGSDPKKQEDYWMKTLKTMVPYGLNIEDSV